MKKDYEQIIRDYRGGDLDLSGCTIKNLELGNIEGSLNLSKAVIDKMAIGWVSETLNMTGAEIKSFACPIDAKNVNMTNAKIKKMPAHIGADYLTVEKSSVTKFNEVRVNTLNIKNTKVEQLPKDMRVNTLIVDSKTAKNLPLSVVRQCGTMEIDGFRYVENNTSVEGFNFCSVNSEVCTCC